LPNIQRSKVRISSNFIEAIHALLTAGRGLQPIRIKLSPSHCDDDNAGRGLQPQSKRLDAPKRGYITKSRPVSSVIFQR